MVSQNLRDVCFVLENENKLSDIYNLFASAERMIEHCAKFSTRDCMISGFSPWIVHIVIIVTSGTVYLMFKGRLFPVVAFMNMTITI